jgi:hypothetical protein
METDKKCQLTYDQQSADRLFGGMYKTKGQINPGMDGPGRLWHLVFPKMLHGTCHQQERAMGQRDLRFFKVLPELMTNMKRPGLAKADRSNGGVAAELFFVIAMPTDAVVPIAIKIKQHAVESSARDLFYVILYE